MNKYNELLFNKIKNDLQDIKSKLEDYNIDEILKCSYRIALNYNFAQCLEYACENAKGNELVFKKKEIERIANEETNFIEFLTDAWLGIIDCPEYDIWNSYDDEMDFIKENLEDFGGNENE